MPRAKRPLADANVNAPPAKKTRGGKDTAPDVVDLTTATSSPSIQSESAPKKTTTKPSKQPARGQDQEHDEEDSEDGEESNDKESKNALARDGSTTTKPKKNTQPRWTPMCAPEISIEYVDNRDPDSFEDTHTCEVCKNPQAFMAKNPKWPWVISSGGFSLMKKWLIQMDRRDPDLHNAYFNNDFASYGCVEVLENIVLELQTELDREKMKPMPLWHHVEGLSQFLDRGTFHLGLHSEGEQVERLLDVVGAVILSALNRLIDADKLDKKTKLPNIVPVFAQLVSWAKELEDFESTVKWANSLVYILNHLEDSVVDFSIIRGSESWVKEAEEWWNEEIGEDESVDMDEDGKMTKESILESLIWDIFDYEKKIEAYIADYGDHELSRGPKPIGGTYYDITKMPKETLEEDRWNADQY